MKNLAVICVTDNGEKIANKIKEKMNSKLNVSIYSREIVKNKKINNIMKDIFCSVDFIVFISSTGIAVRSIASFIKNKKYDPGIIAIDNSAKYAISLLSGHLGGANEITLELSKVLGTQAVITTATDNLGIVAPDVYAKENDLVISNMGICKNIAASLVNGGKVGFLDESQLYLLPKGYEKYNDKEKYDALLVVTRKAKVILDVENSHVLRLIPKDIVIGIGCKKNYPCDTMSCNVKSKLTEMNIDSRAVSKIGTAWVKKDEKAIEALALELGCKLEVFSKDDISLVHNNYKGSDFVFKTIGVRGVCEPCVELMKATIIMNKVNINGMTMCIGRV